MAFIKKYRVIILLSILLIAVYLITRLINLTHLPIFTDEAIYIRWSQIAKQDASWRFISLTDGRQPMYVWVTMTLLRLIHDPLFAGRLTSVITGLFSMIGMFFLSRELFKNKWIGLLAAGIYAVFPFAVVYDRMALYDSMVVMFAIWGLFIEVLLVRRLKSHLAFIAGLIVGGGMLTKSNAFFNIYFLPFTLLLFDFSKNQCVKRFVRWVLLAILTTGLAYMYYSILRLSPYFGIIAEKNYTFIYSFHDWLQHPFTFFGGNFHGLFFWMITYINWLGFVLVVASFFILRKYWREKLLLLVWFGLPFLALAIDGKVLYPRYILPMVIFLIPLMAVSISTSFRLFNKKIVGTLLIILLFGAYLLVDRYILFDFAHAPIPGSDLAQYSNSWPAGAGVREITSFLSQKAQQEHIYVATQGMYGLMPEAMEIYLANNPNVTIKGYWPIPETLPTDLENASKQMPTYVVFYEPCTSCTNDNEPPAAWPVKLIASYRQGTSNWFMRLYQIIPQ